MKPGAPRVYLDWNATAPLRPEARAAMVRAMDLPGNPSSVHAEGRAARALVETARAEVAALVGTTPDRVVFTSGATEAAATMLSGRRVAAAGIEHECVAAHAAPAQRLDTGADGRVRATIGGQTLADGLDADVVAVMAAQNETGVLQPVGDIAAAARAARPGARAVCDAVQAAGRIALSPEALGVDALFVSAHKIGGPKGVGALVLADGTRPEPLIAGGGQERGHRAGTENLPGIAGFGAAAEAARRELGEGLPERLEKLRTILESALVALAPDLIIFGKDAARLANTCCFAVPGWKGETQVMQMDLAGFAVSAGSACSSGKVGANRALHAMGWDAAVASSAIRVSMGPTTTEREVLAFVDAWGAACARRRDRAA